MPFPHRPMQATQVGLAGEPLEREAEYTTRLAVTQKSRERCAMGTQLLIGSRETPSARGKTFERRNPVTGDVATVAAAATVEDAVQAADAAAAAFPAWSATGPNARRALLNK